MFASFAKFADRLNGFFGFVSGLAVVCAAGLIVAEIACRVVSGGSLMVSDEYSGYLMAVSSFMGLGYVEMKGGHLRMDLVDILRARCPRLSRCLRVMCYALAAGFALYLTWVGWDIFFRSLVRGSKSVQISETPLALPQAFLPLGSAALFIQYIRNVMSEVWSAWS
ncbi:MAG: TRAP transporter small permease [Synergistaceae bacterium]|jgi:TRAP-type C4-dicarboxylate transport system permease small subunit|nr:TRAP transporter small permease [Synergistaceae bacterium]